MAPPRPGPALPDRLRRLLVRAGAVTGLGSQLPRPADAATAAGTTSNAGTAATAATAATAGGPFAPRALQFPRDHGSHPQTRIEWWYITGHALAGSPGAEQALGFQLTFFRSRVDATQQLASRFAARQLLFAHAAVTDLAGKRFWHDQRIGREGFAVVSADTTDTRVRIGDWSLAHEDGHYRARIAATGFNLALDFTATQAVLLQGDGGLSRKGPQAGQASFYYSRPQLAVRGTIDLGQRRLPIDGAGGRDRASAAFEPSRGAAWLDHEWSDSLLHPDAVGWDWVGINLFDGSALTAFRIRDKEGQALWDGGSFRHPRLYDGSKAYVFSRGEAVFQPVRGWKSPLSNATYPVEWLLRTPAENYVLRAVLDNQELDSRRSTGAIYWEGLCDLFDSQRRHVGRGYLELTGYARPLVL